ncbi:hypothetical protein FWH58_00075 [Candidatus Saccharibacteria bacterium]|nr:hypothetical protein [Candidatus Saccharibacteria bacterium]
MQDDYDYKGEGGYGAGAVEISSDDAMNSDDAVAKETMARAAGINIDDDGALNVETEPTTGNEELLEKIDGMRRSGDALKELTEKGILRNMDDLQHCIDHLMLIVSGPRTYASGSDKPKAF